jgi:hypothetical protein
MLYVSCNDNKKKCARASKEAFRKKRKNNICVKKKKRTASDVLIINLDYKFDFSLLKHQINDDINYYFR